ncbi:hypothetical protein ASPZODRAFT_1260759 [Penicilliopsis zonata CBS 506.65]|uniref:DUF4440 domain-containing protein n=1 Tax=Penicilliopsis zonata CBS 506.65 TaxID=1073090 RepID=A0A1L9S6N0_9EURO|nr:hypothetical protein ASPZODRAFT_1260759 [Penicilliopsis zonata CBS 506.65]OJJ42819.1 hypothetical protein ASPZODRAFT_1260759 [Penicilliopsis zonata CBS 506.65]
MPSMHDRIREDLLLHERSLWTALTSADPGPAVEKLCNEDANLLFPSLPILHLESEPSIKEAMAPPFHRFDSFSLGEVRTIVIDLMAGVVTYTIHATRGRKEYNALGSTTWSQGSDGEWRICVHQETMM